MKKSVLLLLAAGSCMLAGAQKITKHKGTPVKAFSSSHHKAPKNDPPSFFSQSLLSKENDRKKGGLRPENTGVVHCGSAFNLYGVLDASTTAVTYDSSLGTILFTHREDDSKVSTGGSGAYEGSNSENSGGTWDTNLVVFTNISTRYPNGVIYNPAGNTTLSNAFWLTNGPVTTSNTTDQYTSWDSIASGSISFGGSNLSQIYKNNEKAGVVIQEGINYMSIGSDGIAHSVGDGFYEGTTGDTYLGTSLNTFSFNSGPNNFTWNQSLVRPHFTPDDVVSTNYDSIPEFLSTSGTAWSQDGKTGYIVYFGNLDSTDAISGNNLDFGTYQPIVYKTTNSGATWSMMAVHNWRDDSVLVQHLFAAPDSDVVAPFPAVFYKEQGGGDDYDLVVDANNNLHIFTGITSAASLNVDSAGYTFTDRIDYIFDLYTTSSAGGWRARYIDSLQSLPVELCSTANSGTNWNSTGTGPLAMGHRIQATRTTDGTKVFVTWLDDVVSGTDSIYNPDMFGQGYDVNSHQSTPVKRFDSSADRFYICVSDKPIVTGTSGSHTYTIPVVRVEGPVTANDGTLPVDFVYDADDVFTDADFNNTVGVQTIKPTTFSITQNYPNPFNGITRFGINLTKESNVNVDVFNMVGQKMVSMSPERLGAGSHTITINGSGFATGVYFYRVTVDGSSLTQKMIVE